jgi:hypothetical protein
MTDTEQTEKHPLPFGDQDYIIECARGIVTNELLIADLSNSSWQASLALMIEKLAAIPNLGLVLVPRGPHAHGYWINGTAPGMTFQCQMVAVEDMTDLRSECERMFAALHSNEPPNKETTMNTQPDEFEPVRGIDPRMIDPDEDFPDDDEEDEDDE